MLGSKREMKRIDLELHTTAFGKKGTGNSFKKSNGEEDKIALCVKISPQSWKPNGFDNIVDSFWIERNQRRKCG